MTDPTLYLNLGTDLDLRKVRYFLAVAAHLNFSRASEELLVAQPALSRAVKALETDLGVQLLIRNNHAVSLTDAGRALVHEGGSLLTASLAARRRVRAEGVSGTTLSIGFRPGIIITPVVQLFTRDHPDVVVVAHRIEWDQQGAALLDGRVDVAWIRTPLQEPSLQMVDLFEDAEMIALPVGHRLAQCTSVTLDDLQDEAMLRYDAAPLHDTGRPATFSGVRTMEEKLEAVALGHGIALLPETAARYYQRADIVYLPVTDAPPYRVALATIAGGNRPEVRAFIQAARSLYPARGRRDTAQASPVPLSALDRRPDGPAPVGVV